MPAKRYIKLPTLSEQQILRFWAKIDKTPGQGPRGDCWEWKGHRHKRGYGTVCFYRTGPVRANRMVYLLTTGADPAPLDVLHNCDNPPCCRPDHLYCGTHADNMHDMIAKGRARRATGDLRFLETRPRGDSHYMKKHPEKILRGSKNPGSVLTPDQVRYFRSIYTGHRGQLSQLGRESGIHRRTISDAVHRKTYQDVA